MKHARTSSKLKRRDFLKATSLTGLALAEPSFDVLGANEEIRLASIGLGNKGKHHVELFSALPGVRVAALGETDPNRLAPQAEKLQQRGPRPFTTTDPRRLLERADVDAVVIATPNHWHALLQCGPSARARSVRREARVAQRLGRRAHRRGGQGQRPHRPGGHAVPPLSGSARRRLVEGRPHWRTALGPGRLVRTPAPDRQVRAVHPDRPRLRPLVRPGAAGTAYASQAPLRLALGLVHRGWRPGQQRHSCL